MKNQKVEMEEGGERKRRRREILFFLKRHGTSIKNVTKKEKKKKTKPKDPFNYIICKRIIEFDAHFLLLLWMIFIIR